jgi:hypothetical protein
VVPDRLIRLVEFGTSPDQHRIQTITGRPASFSAETNRIALRKWLKKGKLRKDDLQSSKHIAESIDAISTLSLKEQDKMQWIMNSSEFNDWLDNSESRFLLVEAETSPDTTENHFTCTTGFMCKLISSTKSYPVLSFFCGHRSHQFWQSDLLPAMLMLNTFNFQLMKFIQTERNDVDLSLLITDKAFRKAQRSFKHGLALFRHLLGVLDGVHAMFVFIDLLSFIPKDRANVDAIVKSIVGKREKSQKLIIKVFITDPLADFSVKPDITLHVPDFVDGDRTGLHTDSVSEEKNTALLKFKKEQEKAESSPSEDSDSTASEGDIESEASASDGAGEDR